MKRIYRVTVTFTSGPQAIVTVEAASRKQARRACRDWAAAEGLEVVTAQATCVGRDEPVLHEAGAEIEQAIADLLVDATPDMKQRIATLLGE